MPFSGANTAAKKYISVATIHIAGPGVVFNMMARINPRIAANKPNKPDKKITFFSLLLNSRAVEAGVISMATTNMTPSDLRLETTANDNSSIKL